MSTNNVVIEKRKTWNKEIYSKRAKEREQKEMKEMLNIDLDQIKNDKSLVLILIYPHTMHL